MFKLWQKIYKSLKKSEKRFLFLVSLIILAFTCLPLIAGYLTAGSDKVYTNSPFLCGADRMVYFSQIEEIRQGGLLNSNLYDSQKEPVKMFAPLWLSLGFLARVTNLSTPFIFHLARLVLGFVFLFLLYLFIANIFKLIKWRKIVFLILGFGSGLGIFTLRGNWSSGYLYEYLGTDFWVSEGNTFLSLFHSPLFILSQLLILLIFWWAIERLLKAGWGEVIGVGLMALLLGLMHPYDLITVFSVLVIWFILKCIKSKKWFGRLFTKLFVIGLFAGLAFIYFYLLKMNNLAFAEWLKQNITLSPKIFNYFIGYGMIFVLYLVGIYKTVKSKHKYLFFLSIWSIVNWFLLFMPIQFQRKLANGLHIPLVIIAGVGLILIVKLLKRKTKRTNFVRYILLNLLIIFLVSTNIFIIFMDTNLIIKKSYNVMYLTKDEYSAINWLKDNVAKDEIVLSSAPNGNIIPAYAAKKVYIGHGHQTSDWLNKLNYVNNIFFYSNSQDEQKTEWLKKEGIDYLFYSSREKSLGDFEPKEKKYLEPVWPASQLGEQQSKTTIFKVN